MFGSSERTIKEGEIAKGRVLSIDDEWIQIDIGFKSEGMIAAWEFMTEEGVVTVKVGDEVDVLVEEVENEDGAADPLQGEGRPPAGLGRDQQRLRARRAVEGVIVGAREGRPLGRHRRQGVPAGLAGRPAPGAQPRRAARRDARASRSSSSTSGAATSCCRAARCSRRSASSCARRRSRRSKEGQIVDGVIKNLTDYGAFIDLGGIDGLLHITDMSLGPRQPPERALPGRRRDQGQGAQVRRRDRARLARSQADPARSVDRRRRCATRSACASTARSSRSPTTAPSSSSSRASRASSTSRRCRGPSASSTRRRSSRSATGRGGRARRRRAQTARSRSA